jgi:hypothetical protein
MDDTGGENTGNGELSWFTGWFSFSSLREEKERKREGQHRVPVAYADRLSNFRPFGLQVEVCRCRMGMAHPTFCYTAVRF